jgi:putative spermidine/putrescine transport system substrate-binding protein
MQVNRSHKGWIGVLAVTTLALAACGGGSSSDTESSAEASADASAPAASDAAAGGLPDLTGQSFTFAGFGGALQENQTKAWFDPFSQATGATVNQTDNTGLAALQTQADAGSIQWDVVEEAQFGIDTNCGTLFEKIPDVDRSQIDPNFITNDCGVPVVKFSFVLGYNKDKYPTPPDSIGDFINVDEFPGKRAGSDFVQNGVLEAAILGTGVAPEALYPLDVDAGIAALTSIKDDLVFKASFAEIQDALASGEVDMALLPNGRAFNANAANPSINVTWGDALTLWDNLAIPTGSPNQEAAKAFLNYAATSDVQVALAQAFPYGVLTAGEPPVLSDTMMPFFPDNPENLEQLAYQDQTWWGDNFDAVSQQWTAFLSG